jgi:hypothetical protein
MKGSENWIDDVIKQHRRRIFNKINLLELEDIKKSKTNDDETDFENRKEGEYYIRNTEEHPNFYFSSENIEKENYNNVKIKFI